MAVYHTMLVFIVTLYKVSSQNTTQPTTVTECNQPPIIANSNHATAGLSEGSIVTYTCLPGYEATGSHQQTCRNGIWTASGPTLSCNAIVCPSPPSISRGSYRSLSSYRYTVGTVVTYNCYSGYLINGSSADITCQANRTWTTPVPTCVKKDCGLPPVIEGGNGTYTTTDYYSTVVYSCRPGYNLYYNGITQRSPTYSVRCLSSGLWATTPVCQPKDCQLPGNIANGIRYSTGNHKYMDTVSYECKHGYVMKGNATITCKETGLWSVKPECQLVECPTLAVVPNASNNLVSKAYYGNSTVYMCHKGYELIGSPIVSCRSDGTWTQQPICTLVNCRTPPAIHYGKHNWTSTTFNSVADYACEKGYKLIGVAQIVCKSDGRWSEAPTCELPPDQVGLIPDAAAQSQTSESSESSALTAIAVACAVFGVITLLCLVILVYKLFIANRTDKLFSYASYKNGDDTVNSNL